MKKIELLIINLLRQPNIYKQAQKNCNLHFSDRDTMADLVLKVFILTLKKLFLINLDLKIKFLQWIIKLLNNKTIFLTPKHFNSSSFKWWAKACLPHLYNKLSYVLQLINTNVKVLLIIILNLEYPILASIIQDWSRQFHQLIYNNIKILGRSYNLK